MAKVSKTGTSWRSLQEKEIKRLREELTAAQEGARELSRAVDGIIAQVLVSCGTKSEAGYELRIPAVDVGQPFKVSAKVAEGGKEYVITAERQTADT